MKSIVVICLCFLLFSCGPVTEAQVSSTSQVMFDEIVQIYKDIDPTKIDYLFNERRAALMENQLKQLQYPEKLNLQLLYSKELMRYNKIEESIAVTAEIDAALIKLGINLPKPIQEKYLTQKAIIQLRKGELDNCMDSHHSTSCIIPFSKYAEHKKRDGSEKAISYLKSVLEINPENNQAIWLLNIAMETLGRSGFDLEKEFDLGILDMEARGPWKNRAIDYGIDHFGLAGGVIADDFNNDGRIDIVCSSWGEGDGLKYYQNNGKGKFIDASSQSNLAQAHGGLNINQCDFNNDGFLDIFVMRGAWFETEGKIPNSLLQNNGDGSFTDVTKAAGLYTKAPTQASVWIDFNKDGWVDLFVANESSERGQYNNELWMNQKNGKFINKIENSGLEMNGFYKACTQVELEFETNLPALFLSDYKGANKLFSYELVNGQDVKFNNISVEKEIADPETSFSCFAFDYNNSGSENVFVSGYGDKSGKINPTSAAGANYRNIFVGGNPKLYKDLNGKSADNEIVFEKAIFTMGCNFGDLDNDGFEDIYLATGDPAMGSIVPNAIYRNVDGEDFVDISFETGMAHLQKGHGVAFADFDQDGDQDIYHVLGGAYEGDAFQNAYFQNPGNSNNWLVLKLVGTKSNKAAIGAKVHLVIENSQGKQRNIFRKVGSGSSFGANSLQLEIGLGDSEKIKSCKVVWPFEESIGDYKRMATNKFYVLTEGADEVKEEVYGR